MTRVLNAFAWLILAAVFAVFVFVLMAVTRREPAFGIGLVAIGLLAWAIGRVLKT
jgi:hypothetical protein